jgi:NAD(P)-dependent dehydrogenase (short-subunit alcohol dehydrogenase family)
MSTGSGSAASDSHGRAALVVGAGPGISGSLSRRLAAQGYAVGLLGISADVLDPLARELTSYGVTAVWRAADLTDTDAAWQAVSALAVELGGVDHLHFNPSAYRERSPLELTPDELAADVALGVGALLTALQAARPQLRPGARITATGSMAADKPSPSVASLGVQKAALRNLVRSIDAHLAEADIRAVSVTVAGVLAPQDPDSPFHPDQVADALVAAARQPADTWQAEVRHPA